MFKWLAKLLCIGFSHIEDHPIVITTCWIDHIQCEKEIRCRRCGQVIDYWAYGNFEKESEEAHDYVELCRREFGNEKTYM